MRYFGPLALLSLVVFAPFIWLAWHTPIPPDAAAIKAIIVVAWLSIAYVGCAQILLAGAASAAKGTQLAALRAGARQLVRAALPCAVALAAVVVGGMALALPGLALLGLFSLTATSDEPGLPGPLLDSARIVRRRWKRVAITLVAIAIADAAIIFAVQRFAIASPLKKPLTPADLAQVQRMVRYVALGFAILSPFAAIALAQIRAIDSRPDASPDPVAPPAETSASPP